MKHTLIKLFYNCMKTINRKLFMLQDNLDYFLGEFEFKHEL